MLKMEKMFCEGLYATFDNLTYLIEGYFYGEIVGGDVFLPLQMKQISVVSNSLALGVEVILIGIGEFAGER